MKIYIATWESLNTVIAVKTDRDELIEFCKTFMATAYPGRQYQFLNNFQFVLNGTRPGSKVQVYIEEYDVDNAKHELNSLHLARLSAEQEQAS